MPLSGHSALSCQPRRRRSDPWQISIRHVHVPVVQSHGMLTSEASHRDRGKDLGRRVTVTVRLVDVKSRSCGCNGVRLFRSADAGGVSRTLLHPPTCIRERLLACVLGTCEQIDFRPHSPAIPTAVLDMLRTVAGPSRVYRRDTSTPWYPSVDMHLACSFARELPATAANRPTSLSFRRGIDATLRLACET